MTWGLFATWVAVFAVAADQSRAAASFQGRSQGFQLALGISATLAFIAALALLGWASWAIAWWWGPVLFLAGSAAGALVLGVAQTAIGQLPMTLAGFAIWPAAVVGFVLLMASSEPEPKVQPEQFSKAQVQREFEALGQVMIRLDRAAEIAGQYSAGGQLSGDDVQAMNAEFYAAFLASRSVKGDVLSDFDSRIPVLLKWTLEPLEKCNPAGPVASSDFVACQVAAQAFGEGIEAVRKDFAARKP